MALGITDIRYIIHEGACYGGGFIVYDQLENREVCGCALRKDAGRIAGALNREEIREYIDSVEG